MHFCKKELTMEGNERIDYLIKVLEGNNARKFADKTGIPPDSLSRARNGITNPSTYFTKILKAYDQVRSWWLLTGEGEPLYEDVEKGEVLMKVEALEKEVRALRKAIEKLTKTNLLLTPKEK